MTIDDNDKVDGNVLDDDIVDHIVMMILFTLTDMTRSFRSRLVFPVQHRKRK